MTRQFAAFLLAGGVAAAANVGARLVFSRYFGLEVAVVLAYLVGMAVAFALMRSRVFPAAAGSLARQISMFTVINAVAVLQTLVVTIVLARWALPATGMEEHVEDLAHVVGVCVPIVTSFFGHKYVSFR